MAETGEFGNPMIRPSMFFVLAVVSQASFGADFGSAPERYDYEEKPWVELQTALPEYPKEQDLIEFSVGPTERNRFYIDGNSITIGTDGVVRYVLVVKTVGGATNTSFEAMRCETRELKMTAIGRTNSTWVRMENPQWQRVENKIVNRYHAVLNREILCPAGLPPQDANVARMALRNSNRPLQ